MRILMATPQLPHPAATNAGALVMYAQLMRLREQHQVTLVTFAGRDPGEDRAIAVLRDCDIDVHAIWRSSMAGGGRGKERWRHLPAWLRGDRPLSALEFAHAPMQCLLDRLLSRKPFDLIQVEYHLMGGYHYRTSAPAVLTEHEPGLIPAHEQRLRAPNLLRRLFYDAEWQRWRRYEAAMWQRFDRIQVFTPRDATAIRMVAPQLSDRVCVNPFGIELPPLPARQGEEPRTLVFIGWFAHPPNAEAALWLGREIMPRLRARCPNVRLLIVGGRPTEEIRALAGEDIIVTGRVPAVEPYLERAAVVIAPLRSGGGMRLKVLQAMGHGKAVVTTPLGADGLTIGNAAPPLAIASDADGLARAAAELLADEQARRALGRRARAFVGEHYTWSAYQQRLEKIYRGLVPLPTLGMTTGVTVFNEELERYG